MKIKTKILKNKDTNDADIKDGEDCLDKKNIAIMKKKKKMKTVNTKVYNEKLNRSTKHKDIKNIDYNSIDHSSTTSLPTSKKTVFFTGDSMAKKLNGFYITKRNKHKYLTNARSFSSAKTRCMFDQTKPTIEKNNPEDITLNIGLNWGGNCQPDSKFSNRTCELSKEQNKHCPYFIYNY